MEDPVLIHRNKKLPIPDPFTSTNTTSTNRVSKENEYVMRDDDYLQQMNDHYSHLQKHVTEVRRQRLTNTLPPQLADYQEKLNDRVISTRWIDYVDDYIKYYLNLAAYDDIDKPLEPFSLNQMRLNLDRLYPMLSPIISLLKKIVIIYEWENAFLTLALFSAYFVLWYYDLILPCLLLGIVMMVSLLKIQSYAQYNLDVLGDELESDNSLKKWHRDVWTSIKSSYNNALPNHKPFEGKSLGDWKDDVYDNYGPVIQLMLSDTINYLERIKNLITWKRPARTRLLIITITIAAFMLVFLPYKIISKSVFFYIGIDFFILQFLRFKYPRHRRIFNVLNLFLWGVPNDAEYALEVVQLSQGPNRSKGHEGLVDTHPLPPTPGARMDSNASDYDSDKALPLNRKPKEAVDGYNTNVGKNDELIAFACKYGSTTSGYIRMDDKGFMFQSSRLRGNQILVDCLWNDIIGLKKTKGLNMIVWHATGIEVALASGETLQFNSVSKRDDCFNRMVISSRDPEGEWKKM